MTLLRLTRVAVDKPEPIGAPSFAQGMPVVTCAVIANQGKVDGDCRPDYHASRVILRPLASRPLEIGRPGAAHSSPGPLEKGLIS